MAGVFVTFEGVDGCGKSTQIRLLSEYLTDRGWEVLTTREPGGCEISEQIRALLLDPANKEMTRETEALLYAAARAQHVAQIIRPALAEGKIVISDRYLDSSLAYQGGGRRLGHRLIEKINGPAVSGLKPDLTFFLDLPPHKAFERMHREGPHDRLEQQDAAFHERLYQEFLRIGKRDPQRVKRIDVSGSKDETQAKIRTMMDAYLTGQGGRP